MPVNDNVSFRLASETDLLVFDTEPNRHGMLRERLARQHDGRGELWMAFLGNEPVGYVFLWFDEAEEPIVRERLEDVPLIMNLWIHEDYRNRGYGRRLVSRVEDRLRELEFSQVALGVGHDNTVAIRMYDRLGYSPWDVSPQIHTIRVEFGHDGSVLASEDETCDVYVKDLARVTALVPAP